ncbi:hypothetical protein [Mycobacterium celatum]|uniref:DUF4145 domain-containing protein n=1 Tax=Mycobacterium celatum TaxID=28045 RepID=A0A1X1RMF2_MYCCE|nr:hypothetical protein [Mycobacterium celatum]ORV09813.1 hypothetical protein AWB95_16370 [Mycobacterium celatum]PIB79622.1 hypothetical protein CQY23_06775 [Mycobacterium celatum]
MSAVELLGHAQRILSGSDVEGLSSRLAAFLARQALEEIIEQRCADLGASVPSATARSRLLVLRSLDTDEAADRVARAWNRLSNACHVHAYEMQPSSAEIEHLCTMVAALLPKAPQ